MTQWHPLFARLLRLLVERNYDVFTDIPVGDLPRQADILLLRRKDMKSNPFQGVWKHLRIWNVLEFKGPSVSARWHDLDDLVELGLGITRRLNEQAAKESRRRIGAVQVAFWYLANQISAGFIRRLQSRIGTIAELDAGLWQGVVLDHPLLLVSRVSLQVESDSIPLHLLADEPIATATLVGRYLLEHEKLWEQYGEWFAALHPAAWDEVKSMAAAKAKKFGISLDPILEQVGVKEVLKRIGAKRLMREGLKDALRGVSLDELMPSLPAELQHELKRRLK